jgi:transcriptional regulator with XRE-family HTH domain
MIAMPQEPKKAGPQTRALIEALRAWCDVEYGRKAEVARALGVSRYAVNHWLSGRQIPSAEHALTLQQFLKKQRGRK